MFEYEKLENELMIDNIQDALPVRVGDFVYIIREFYATKKEFKEPWGHPPRIEKTEVTKIGCDKKGWYIIVGNTRSRLNKYNITWFKRERFAKEVLERFYNKLQE